MVECTNQGSSVQYKKVVCGGPICPTCKAMYPHEREIVARFKARPFALLSVMTDEDMGPIRKEIQTGEFTWRCWWERGGPDGSIPTAWNVRGYPTVFVLDQNGVFRLKFTGNLASPERPGCPQPPIDAFIERLLKEPETEADHSRPS